MTPNITIIAPNQTTPISAYLDEPTEYDRNGEIIYPEQRETDMGETWIHNTLAGNLSAMLRYFFENREDVFVAANLNLYYEKGTPQKWYAPDIFVAFGAGNYPRSSYRIWEENIFPQVVFEIASDKTWEKDIGEKYRFYESFGVEEYYILDAEFMFLTAPLMAFHHRENRFTEIDVENSRIFSPRLGLEIVQVGRDFRFFNPETNEFLQTLTESEREKAQIKHQAETEIAKLKAEIERLKSQK